MKNEGFTLIELLAVLLILAFIALIAVPQILNLIEQSKIKSLKISTSEYIRAVNTSLMNEEVFNNVKDGLYTIADDGKKIVLGDTEIYIASEGHGLRSGLLLIENSKVKRVLKGMIDDYYARVNGEEITILKNLNESTLVNGETFNIRIKTLVDDELGDKTNYKDVADTTVKKITFLQDSVLPEGYTKEQLQLLKSTDLSEKNDNSIKGYYDESSQTIYVYSDGYISCPNSLAYLFYNFQGVEEIELNLIDTSNVTNMEIMFANCQVLKVLNLIGLDTSKVKIMGGTYSTVSGMFSGCTNLEEIKGLEVFDTSNVTNMGHMFYNCSSLISLDLSGFNTLQVGNMNRMFQGCSSLEKLDISNFNTSKVTTMEIMFSGCSSLTSLDLSGFDTSQVGNMHRMFESCSSLKYLNLSKWDTGKVTNMSNMFHGCSSLTSLDLSSFNTLKVTAMGDWNGGMFMGCTNLKSIKFGENFVTSNVTNFGGMFAGCSSLETLDLTYFDMRQKTAIISWNGGFFQNCTSLKSIKFGPNFTLENVTALGRDDANAGMFSGCSSLTELDLTSFDTKNITVTRCLFQGCTNLKEVKVTTGKWTLDTNLLNGTQTQDYTYVN